MRSPLIEVLPKPPGAAAAFEAIKDRPFSFFLDSGMDPGNLGRFSFIGSDPFLVLKSKGKRISVGESGREAWRPGDPFDVLRSLLAKYSLDHSETPVPFNGGVVGYFSYDLCHLIERLPSRAIDDLQLPETCLGFYDIVAAFDNLQGRGYIISTGFPETEDTRRIGRAKERLAEFRSLIETAESGRRHEAILVEAADHLKLCSNFARDEYIRAVQKAREYIIAGDVFQVNLSQRFETELKVPPYELYKRLRHVNPAPFACYFSTDDVIVAGSSPERFLHLSGDVVETRPIKGTRPRTSDPGESEAMAMELLSSAKDRAENVMIVDLERNDLGRVCVYGSVKVKELAALERFPTVFHLTSTVTGRLRPGMDRIDLVRATFPGGSITGAPKVRSMEIIDELEPTRRSVYTGSVGYLGYDGRMDLNIVIRTFLIKGKRAYFQVGGGIVYDSKPDGEYQETLDKARGLIAALKLAPQTAVEVA